MLLSYEEHCNNLRGAENYKMVINMANFVNSYTTRLKGQLQSVPSVYSYNTCALHIHYT